MQSSFQRVQRRRRARTAFVSDRHATEVVDWRRVGEKAGEEQSGENAASLCRARACYICACDARSRGCGHFHLHRVRSVCPRACASSGHPLSVRVNLCALAYAY
eukprot:6211969-Pleurochrysis_carterae.AAC.3